MTYAIPILVLACTILAFFGLARGRYALFGVTQILLRILVALPLLASAVLLHFFRTDASASIIPPVFPARHLLVLITGVLEILGAIGLSASRLLISTIVMPHGTSTDVHRKFAKTGERAAKKALNNGGCVLLTARPNA